MKRMVLSFAIASVTAFASGAHAYEVDTHALITSEAYADSVMNTPALQQRMGWDRYRLNEPFRMAPASESPSYPPNAYFDVRLGQWQLGNLPPERLRVPQIYERGQMAAPERNDTDLENRLIAWLMRGVIREDDLPPSSYRGLAPDVGPDGARIRVFNHFFNPLDNTGLVVGNDFIGAPAVPWAIDDVLSIPPPLAGLPYRNNFSWLTAREAMWCALTRTRLPRDTLLDAGLRRLCWATAISALGHSLHLLQDLAQPQHVRNDPHNPPNDDWYDSVNFLVATSISRRTMEVFTNWRATQGEVDTGCVPANVGRPSPTPIACKEAQQFRSAFTTAFGSGPPPLVFPDYPGPGQSVRFAGVRDYYTSNRRPNPVDFRRGLADFTNRTFYSEGTLFDDSFPFPPADRDDPTLGTRFRQFSRFPGGVILVQSVTRRTIDDRVAPGFVDADFDPASGLPLVTESVWNAFNLGSIRLGTLTLADYAVQANVLLPRAVGYSAGLIDHFFRGVLEVRDPSTQVVSALDHARPHSLNPSGWPVTPSGESFGFNYLRLQVRNATPNMVESGTGRSVPQNMTSGQLVAVARFHRNPCYRPDLTGDNLIDAGTGASIAPVGCTIAQTRNNWEEIAVSAPISIGLSPGLPKTFTDYRFDFSASPIPINASDLRVQVVFRGLIGQASVAGDAEEGAIAVGYLDLTEPMYFAVANQTDYYVDNQAAVWRPSQSGVPGIPQRESLELLEYFAGVIGSGSTATFLFRIQDSLPASRVVRVAVIGRSQPPWVVNFVARYSSDGLQVPGAGLQMDGPWVSHRQGPREELAPGDYQPRAHTRTRGVPATVLFCVSRSLGPPPVPAVTCAQPPLLPPYDVTTPVANLVQLVPPNPFVGVGPLRIPGVDSNHPDQELRPSDIEPRRRSLPIGANGNPDR